MACTIPPPPIPPLTKNTKNKISTTGSLFGSILGYLAPMLVLVLSHFGLGLIYLLLVAAAQSVNYVLFSLQVVVVCPQVSVKVFF